MSRPVLEFQILGPLQVIRDGVPLPLPGHKLRTLLALLLVQANGPVESDQLIEAVWGAAPGDAQHRLHAHITRLRSALGVPGMIVNDAGTYRLNLDSAAVDRDLFEGAVSAATASRDPAEGAAAFKQALSLWRGPALAEFHDQAPIRAEAVRLEELRLTAVEGHFDAELELGHHQDLIPNLRMAIGANPLRERLAGQLMLALYRAGRQGEAGEAYQRTRQRLVEELGVEPSPPLQDLVKRILSQDTALNLMGSPSCHGPTHNLPFPVSSLVGRKEAIGRVEDLLNEGRLVTLTGAGGIGKTRLALEVGHRQLATYPDGVWGVCLESITDSDLIAQAFVEAVAPPEKNLPSLLRHLHSRQALLIVDNCEHFVEGVAQLVELIVRRCVGVTVLATSREHLGVSGEAVFRVPPLSQKTSVRLLMERSRLREPGLSAPNQTSSEVLTRIADRLDGIPLALELVAGALDMLTPEQVLAGLDARFEMPLTGSRTASPRHQTLRATVEWSHDLLGPEEKLLFRRLAIFRSSFTLESAEAICADSSIPAPQIALVLRHLIDKSLVVVGTGIGGPSRYRIFETIRAFAWEHLQAEGDLPDLRRRQAAFLAEMAIGAETKLSGAAAEHWLSEMSEEQPNLGMVLEWARTEDPSVVLRLSAAWWPYWILSGHIRAGQGWLEGALATDVDDLPVQMAALHGAGRAACRKGDFDLAQSNFDRQLALATMLEDRGQQVMALNAMGLMKAAWEDWSAAQSDFSLAQSLAEGGDIRLLAMTRSNLGICIARNGNLARAKRAFAQAYSVMLAAGDRNGIARQSLLLGELALVEGQLDEARELLKASVLDYMRLGDQFFVIATLKAFAHWLAVAGAEELSLRVAGAVEAAQTQMGVTGWASPHETARRAARARAWQSLGPDLATRAESAGATASTADAMEEALTWTPPHCTEAPPSRLRAFAPE